MGRESYQENCARVNLLLNDVEEDAGQHVCRTDRIVCIWLKVCLAESDAEETRHNKVDHDQEVLGQVCFSAKMAHGLLIETLAEALVRCRSAIVQRVGGL